MIQRGMFGIALATIMVAKVPAAQAETLATGGVGMLDVEFAIESPRELGWWDPAQSQVFRNKTIRRYSLFCGPTVCELVVWTFPSSNCVESGEAARGGIRIPPLEATQAGSQFDIYYMWSQESGRSAETDLAVTRRSENSVLIEYTSHEMHKSKISMLLSYRNVSGTSSASLGQMPVKVSGRETGVGQGSRLNVGGDEIVQYEYKQLPETVICYVNSQRLPLRR